MTLALNQPSKPHVKRWTKQEYYDLIDRGAFRKQRVFLFRGELIEMPPMGSLHAYGVSNVTEWLCATFRPKCRIRIQEPFVTPGDSLPEPDGGVVTDEQMARQPHPNRAMMLIEVSDSSLEFDQQLAFEYAASEVPEYWIVNVRDRCVEAYREPIADASATLGYRYRSHRIYEANESIAPLAAPDTSVMVASLVATS